MAHCGVVVEVTVPRRGILIAIVTKLVSTRNASSVRSSPARPRSICILVSARLNTAQSGSSHVSRRRSKSFINMPHVCVFQTEWYPVYQLILVHTNRIYLFYQNDAMSIPHFDIFVKVYLNNKVRSFWYTCKWGIAVAYFPEQWRIRCVSSPAGGQAECAEAACSFGAATGLNPHLDALDAYMGSSDYDRVLVIENV